MNAPVSSRTLLSRYVDDTDEAAFAEIIRRHLPLVYSTALRKLGGDRSLAEDCTQIVFIDLVRKASKIGTDVSLGAWLHRHTGFTASKMVESERRRKRREYGAAEQDAYDRLSVETAHSTSWQLIQVVDDALGRLPERDRTAIALRFLDGHRLKYIGELLGTSEDAARKRVARALDKLRQILQNRGVTLSAISLSGLLAKDMSSAEPPSGLIGEITSSVFATGTLTGIPIKAIIGGAIAAALMGSAVLLLQITTRSKLSQLLQTRRTESVHNIRAASGDGPSLTKLQPQVIGLDEKLSLNEIFEHLDILSRKPRNILTNAEFKQSVGQIRAQDLLRAAQLADQRFDRITLLRFREAIFERWFQFDPASALTEGIEWVRESKRWSKKVETAFTGWVRHDSRAAVDWWKATFEIEQPDGSKAADTSNVISHHMSFRLAEEAPKLAIEISDSFKLDYPRRALRMNAFNTWLDRAPVDAYEWAAQLESPAERFDRAMRMRKVEDHQNLFGETWRDSDDVIAWSLAKTPKIEQPGALAKILGYWQGAGKVQDAVDWLAKQPASEEMDIVMASFATIKRLDQAVALTVAARVTNETDRELLMSGIFRRWHRRNPTQALEFLSNSTWPSDQLQMLEATINNG